MAEEAVRCELAAGGTCSFCGKSRRDTRALVGSPIMDVKICDAGIGAVVALVKREQRT